MRLALVQLPGVRMRHEQLATGAGLPEEAPPAVHAVVGLHALEAAHAVVQHLGGRVHGDALQQDRAK